MFRRAAIFNEKYINFVIQNSLNVNGIRRRFKSSMNSTFKTFSRIKLMYSPRKWQLTESCREIKQNKIKQK
jgi:hypothetical protein